MKIFSSILKYCSRNLPKAHQAPAKLPIVRKNQCGLEEVIIAAGLNLSVITLIGVLAVCFWVSPTAAVDHDSDVIEPDKPLQLEESPDKTFRYVLEDRPDPFAPFISEKSVEASKSDEIIEENVELIGMRQFEPGQLTLVAVLAADEVKIAMVEDVTGKGYIINEGTPIGRRGIVSEIKEEEVIITETAHTRAGRKLINKITMRLNKEGD